MYSRSLVEASKAALIEMLIDLESYKDHFVLGGGWASYFVLNRLGNIGGQRGSADIDFVLEPSAIKSELYRKILSAVMKNGFRPYETRSGVSLPYRFYREVHSPLDNRSHIIKVDFITEPLISEKGSSSRFTMGQGGTGAVAISGVGIVLQHNFEQRIRGALPNGGEDSVKCKVADFAGCLITKALALKGREKKKDLYDIMDLLRYYPRGLRWIFSEADTNTSVLAIKEAVDRITKNLTKEKWVRTFGAHEVTDLWQK